MSSNIHRIPHDAFVAAVPFTKEEVFIVDYSKIEQMLALAGIPGVSLPSVEEATNGLCVLYREKHLEKVAAYYSKDPTAPIQHPAGTRELLGFLIGIGRLELGTYLIQFSW